MVHVRIKICVKGFDSYYLDEQERFLLTEEFEMGKIMTEISDICFIPLPSRQPLFAAMDEIRK